MRNKRIILFGLLFLLISILLYSVYNIYSEDKEYREVEEINFEIEEIAKEATPVEEDRGKMSWEGYKALRKKIPQMVAYIDYENTQEVVVQANDNFYYLRRLINGRYNALGTVFMNYKNKIDDQNITLYGHNSILRDARFQPILDIRHNHKLLDVNDKIRLFTDDGLKVYQVAKLYAYRDYKNLDHQFTNLDKEDFNKYLEEVNKRDELNRGIDITED